MSAFYKDYRKWYQDNKRTDEFEDAILVFGDELIAKLRAELNIAQGMAQAATYDVQGWMNRARKAEAEILQLKQELEDSW